MYLGPGTLKRNVFIEQAPSAENFCAFKLVCGFLLDGKLGGSTQLGLYQRTRELVNAQTLFLLRYGSAGSSLSDTIALNKATLAALKPLLASLLPSRLATGLAEQARRLVVERVPEDLAADLAALDVLELALAITEVAHASNSPVPEAAGIFLVIGVVVLVI